MATFVLEDYISIGTFMGITAVSWRALRGKDMNIQSNILDESIFDTVNIREWNTPLRISPDSNICHADIKTLYVAIKIHQGDTCSPWYISPAANQHKQMLHFRENGVIVNSVDSLDTNFYKDR